MYQRDFDFLEKNKVYQLSVVLMADSFFYSVYDTGGVLLCHQSFTNINFSDEACIATLVNDQNLQLSFSKVNVTVLSDYNYQLPSVDNQLIALFPSLELKNKLVENIPGNQAVNYFGITSHQEALLNQLFGSDGYQIKSFVALIATYFLGSSNDFMFIHVEEGHIYIYVQKNGLLTYYNTFQTKGPDDMLYFLLAVVKETGLILHIDIIYLSGWIEKDSILYKQLSGYVQNVQLVDDKDTFLSPYVNGGNKSHFYFAHNATYICGL